MACDCGDLIFKGATMGSLTISSNTEAFLNECSLIFSQNTEGDRQTKARQHIVAVLRNDPSEASKMLHEIEDNIFLASELVDLHVSRIEWIIETIRA